MVKIDLNSKESEKKYLLGIGVICLLLFPFFISTILPSGIQDERALSRFILLKCPVFFFFDILCPTCGLGRSLISLFLLKFKVSWSYHPGGILLYLNIVIFFYFYFFCPSIYHKVLNLLKNLKKDKKRVNFLTVTIIGSYLIWNFLRSPLN